MVKLLKKNMGLFIPESNVEYLQNIEIEKSFLKFIGLRVIKVNCNSKYIETLNGKEACVVVLNGNADIKVSDNIYENLGKREKTFDKNPTDSIYITNKDSYQITSKSKATIAICYARTDKILRTKIIKANDNVVEHRGKGMNKRLVNNILDDKSPVSDKLIVVEVFTDEANWSSYPPHKHDTSVPGKETNLEEIYYHEMDKPQGFVFQRVYTDDLLLDETMAVQNNDAVMVPKGYHPVAVPYGYNSYYLNVMSGQQKKWLFHNAKEHEWILERNDVD